MSMFPPSAPALSPLLLFHNLDSSSAAAANELWV